MMKTKYRVVVDHTAQTDSDWHRLEMWVGPCEEGWWKMIASGPADRISRVADRLEANGGVHQEVVKEFTV